MHASLQNHQFRRRLLIDLEMLPLRCVKRARSVWLRSPPILRASLKTFGKERRKRHIREGVDSSLLFAALALGGVFGCQDNIVSCKAAASISSTFDRLEFISKKPSGTGSFGTVRVASLNGGKENVAVKIIEDCNENYQVIQDEIEALSRVVAAGGHEHVVSYKGNIPKKQAEASERWLVFEHVDGRELYDVVVDDGPLDTDKTKSILWQILSAVKFLHTNVTIAHGDIKPENIMVDKNSNVKVIDFGSAIPVLDFESKVLDCAERDRSTIGTAAYCAPELIRANPEQELTTAIDVFSLGCVTYVMASGSHPFDLNGKKSNRDVMRSIETDTVQFEGPVWESHPQSLKDLLLQMLEKCPEKRISIEEVFKHPFFHEGEKE